MKRALITGVTGQDGSILSELLLSRGYEVHGIIRRASTFITGRIDHIFQDPHTPKARFFLHYGSLHDASRLNHLIRTIRPDEIYHLGAQSHVRVSFDVPEETVEIVTLGTLRLLEAIREAGLEQTRLYHAASSEMFGASPPPQSEETPFQPRSPYAVAKVAAFHLVKNYREAYGIFASNGILFNHESERRGETFVTRKISRGIAKIIAGVRPKLYLGNLEAKRDWGYAPEYVEAMVKILHHETPDDFVIATGQAHSVKEFLEEAFRLVGLPWQEFIEIDPRYFRPTEVGELFGDASKAERVLGWKPKVTFERLVRIMLEHDLRDLLGEDWQAKVEEFKERRKPAPIPILEEPKEPVGAALTPSIGGPLAALAEVGSEGSWDF